MRGANSLFAPGTPVRLRADSHVPLLLRGRFATYQGQHPHVSTTEIVELETWVNGKTSLEVSSSWLEDEPLPPDAVARMEYMLGSIPFRESLENVYTPYRSAWLSVVLLIQRLAGERPFRQYPEWFWQAESVEDLLVSFNLAKTITPKDKDVLQVRWRRFMDLHQEIVVLEAEAAASFCN